MFASRRSGGPRFLCANEKFLESLCSVCSKALVLPAQVQNRACYGTAGQIEKGQVVCDRRGRALAGCSSMPRWLWRDSSVAPPRKRQASIAAETGEGWHRHSLALDLEKQRVQIALFSQEGAYCLVHLRTQPRAGFSGSACGRRLSGPSVSWPDGR